MLDLVENGARRHCRLTIGGTMGCAGSRSRGGTRPVSTRCSPGPIGSGASRIAFQTGHSPTIRVHGRNRRVGDYPLDEAEIAQIVNHLYGADGSARLQGAGEFDASYESRSAVPSDCAFD